MLTDIIAQINKTSLQNENGNNKEMILSPDACVLTVGFPKTSIHFLFVYCRYLVQKFVCVLLSCVQHAEVPEKQETLLYLFFHMLRTK